MKKTPEIQQNVCPVAQLMKVISTRWTHEILWHLGQEKVLRFNELKRTIGPISTKVLTERLRMLEEKQIVHREHEATIPPAVYYSLTEMGIDIYQATRGIQDVAVKWNFTSINNNKS